MADEKEKDGFMVIVNGTPHTVPNDVVTFEQVVEIAFPNHPTNPDLVFSVTFENAASDPRQGTLATGGRVTVKKHGTVFDVTQTNRS